MANLRWESGAAVTSDTRTYAFGGTWEADDLIRLQVGNKIKDFTAGSTVTATVVSTLKTAINALSESDFPEVVGSTGFTASSSSTTLTLTANTAGVPFICTLTPLEANGSGADAQTIEGAGVATTGTVSVTNAGPNVWSTAANWDTGAAPVATNDVYIDNNSDDILYSLSQAGATFASTTISMTYTGNIGLPKTNTDSADYPEYRTEYLTIDSTLLRIKNEPNAQGSGRIKINSGTVATTVTVENTGQSEDDSLEAFLWKGTNASNVMYTTGDSSVGIAIFGGEVATIATLTVEGNSRVRCGLGTTLTTVTVNSGTLEVRSNITTLTVYSGTVTINGTAAITTLNLYGGTVIYNSTGTLGTATIGASGYLDFGQGVGTLTLTNPIDSSNPNGVNDPDKRLGTGLIVDYNGVEPLSGWGNNIRLTRGNVA